MLASIVRSRWTVLALSVALVSVVLPMTSAVAVAERVKVAGSSPIPSTDTIVNQAITTSFDVALNGANGAALTTFIASLSNPASPQYRHYLTTSQFANQFGATASTVAAVSNYFSGYGVVVGALSKGRILLHLSGTTSAIAKAFATPVATVRRSDGVLAAQFTAPATLPSAIAKGVAGVAGLSTVVPPTSNLKTSLTSHASPGTCPSAGSQSTTPNELGGYPAQQQAQLYGLSAAWANGFTGTGQTIAIYELGTYDAADVSVYLSCYGLTSSITATNVDGGPPAGFSDEATLDIEEAAILAPGAAIKVYQGPNSGPGPADVYQLIADQNIASIVTTSWGGCEADPTGDVVGEQPVFEQMAAQGQTVIAAAGDSGSSDCHGITNNTPSVDDPASQPYVTGVGGLSVNSISPLSQTVWNNGPSGGSGGGGNSIIWSRPSWQVAPGITSAQSMRTVPDLSVMADPNTGFIQYFSGTTSGACGQKCAGGWGSIGGTSIGSPLVSAIVAVAAQSCGASRLGFINPALYNMASTGFVDVTTGTNDAYGVGSYSAGPGYDMATGLGSPNGAAFIAGLCPSKYESSKSSFNLSSTTAIVNSAGVHVAAMLHNTNNSPIVNATVNVTATATGAASSGLLLVNGDPTSATASGQASYAITTDATGTAAFDVTTTAPGPVALVVTYGTIAIFSSTVTFTSPHVATTVPGRPTIFKLIANVGGFSLSARAPSSNGGSRITSYQYSITAGSKWSSLGNGTLIRVGNLVKGKKYKVSVRAINVNGASVASIAKSIVTRKK
jgi:subtilase family serine protease